jgi:hypothetical protein
MQPDLNSVTRAPAVPPGGRRRRARSVLFVVAITVVMLEGTGRMLMGNLGLPAMQLHPPDGRCLGLRPSSATRYTGWALRSKPVIHDVNGLGYRGPERPRDKAPGWNRILFVGDSVTYGQGVESNEALPSALERILRQRGRLVEVLNFGVPGYNLEEYVDQYRLFASAWQHDLLLVGVVNNDLSLPFCDMIERPVLMWSLKYAYAFRAGYLLWSITFTRGYGNLDSSDGPGRLEARLRGALNQIDQLSRRFGARAAVVAMGPEDINGLPHAKLTEAAGAAGLPILEVGRCVSGGEIPEVPGDGHFSAEGNRMVAECIADWIGAIDLLAHR